MSGGLDALFNRKPPTEWEQFLAFPKRYLGVRLHGIHTKVIKSIQQSPEAADGLNNQIKVVCLSDTHNRIITEVPEGDILIHAGDLTERGTVEEVQKTVDWLMSLTHRHKVVIAGNHDLCLDVDYKGHELAGVGPTPERISWGNIQYLLNSAIVLHFPERNRNIKICGKTRFQ
ncbi:hypothetical protein AA313_de0207173 [Arthrobotrys entomopaga]|nr:hypothetical protein AA313_de0207173 [Arthrobotrys entomopaga]